MKNLAFNSLVLMFAATLFLVGWAVCRPPVDAAQPKIAPAPRVAEIEKSVWAYELTPYRFSDGKPGWCYTLVLGEERFAHAHIVFAPWMRDRLKVASWMLRKMGDDQWYVGKEYQPLECSNMLGCPENEARIRVEKPTDEQYGIVLLIRDSKYPEPKPAGD